MRHQDTLCIARRTFTMVRLGGAQAYWQGCVQAFEACVQLASL